MTEKVEVNDLYYKDKVKVLGRIIREGGLVAFPTETVYGLGGNALDAGAAKKIYAAKGRPSDNPLIVHVADPSEVGKYAAEVSPLARRLMDTFWPGPLTIVFPKKDCIPMETSGGLSTIAIRCPRSEATRALIRAADVPIAGPSANISTRPSPTTADDVLHDMNGRIAAVIDGGPCQIGLESTVVGIDSPRKFSHLVLMKLMLPMVWMAVFSEPSCSIQGSAQMWPSLSVHMVRYSGYCSKTFWR